MTPDPTPAAPAGVEEVPFSPEYERAYNDGVREQAYWTRKSERERNEARVALAAADAKLAAVKRHVTVIADHGTYCRAIDRDGPCNCWRADVLAILDGPTR